MKLLESPPSGEELKEIRLTYYLSVKQMAEVLNVNPQTVRSYEAGRTRIPWKHLKRVNRLLSKPIPPAPVSPDELRLLRTSRGLTQKQVAEAFGVSLTSVVNYEKGHASIPADLPQCIKELAEPKSALPSSDIPSRQSTRALLQQYARNRTEEREKWLSFPREVTPEELREIRLSRGLTEKELSEILGISQTSLHFYETGDRGIPKGLTIIIAELVPDAAVSPAELRALRLSLNLSQADLAEFLGLTAPAIHHYETGLRKIPHDLSAKIMGFFQEEADHELTSEEMRALREGMNLTQNAFAELLGIKRGTEAQYETGKRKIPREIRRKVLTLKSAESE